MLAERGAAMESYDFIAMNNEYVFNTYGRTPVMLVHGAGCKVTDSNGRTYLDFIGGLAACCLGHGHEALARAISEQATKLIHVSNLFYIEPQIKLAKLLTENSFAEKVFFCNSGAEANEAAIKLRENTFTIEGSINVIKSLPWRDRSMAEPSPHWLPRARRNTGRVSSRWFRAFPMFLSGT